MLVIILLVGTAAAAAAAITEVISVLQREQKMQIYEAEVAGV